MIPGVNPRQMKQMMRKMGMQQQEIPAQEVIIKLEDSDMVISNPSVMKVNMMGQETFQISGEIEMRSRDNTPNISDDDIEMVASQANVSPEEAAKAIVASKGDLAEAIMKLKSE